MNRSLTRTPHAVLLCSLALIAFATHSPSAGAAERTSNTSNDESALGVLGRTVLAAIATDPAVDSLGQSIAMLDARFRVKARMREEPREAQGTKTLADYARDPSSIPPASAGSNGTVVPRAHRLRGEEIFAHTRASADPNSTAILLTGVALAPPQAPEAVKGAINAANTIVGRPYVWGGGHGSFYSHGYDCSGSVSFALFGGGLIPRPLTSGELQRWGAPGPGKWITVYANPGHTFVEIAGLRWDTVGDEKGTGPRWHLPTSSTAGFLARHPPGL
jgi:cell wall-associated NlpC family hydrolase